MMAIYEVALLAVLVLAIIRRYIASRDKLQTEAEEVLTTIAASVFRILGDEVRWASTQVNPKPNNVAKPAKTGGDSSAKSPAASNATQPGNDAPVNVPVVVHERKPPENKPKHDVYEDVI